MLNCYLTFTNDDSRPFSGSRTLLDNARVDGLAEGEVEVVDDAGEESRDEDAQEDDPTESPATKSGQGHMVEAMRRCPQVEA